MRKLTAGCDERGTGWRGAPMSMEALLEGAAGDRQKNRFTTEWGTWEQVEFGLGQRR
jgi:hypothetical protein